MEQTPRFALPFLVPGQAQKEWFHNEALQRVDMLLSAVVEGAPAVLPPADPVAGICYLVGAGATGDWTGRDGMVAGYGEGGWRFIAPAEGLRAMRRDNGEAIIFRNGAWESGIVRAAEIRIGDEAVVRHRQAAIPDPAGGTTVDAEGRATVSAILGAMRAHGLIQV